MTTLTIENVSTSFRAYLYDDSCHLYTSDDYGATWVSSVQSTDTQTDDWPDLQIPINDNDFTTLLSFDATYLGSALNSRIAVSYAAGATDTWSFINPAPGAADPTRQIFYSGAISAGGQIMLALPTFGNTTSLTYPRISRDSGSTWSSITNVPSHSGWSTIISDDAAFTGFSTACFAQGAQIMYVAWFYNGNKHTKISGISKSTDGGSTWADVTAPPNLAVPTTMNEGMFRIRCSADGSVVIYADVYGCVAVSRDGGSTWIDVTAQTPEITWDIHGQIDAGISQDGSVLIVSNETPDIVADYPYNSYVTVSKDGGVTWNAIYPPAVTNNHHVATCNVSPGGLAFLIGSGSVQGGGSGTFYSDVSLDQGSTWNEATVPVVIADAWVASYIVPISTATPPPSPFGTPNQGTLIGATYRRVSSFTSESPAFVGWHRHDLGHSRILQSIGISSDVGGLLDHLDMVTTDGTNYNVEGMTRIFDEDDDITDGWFLDGALVPDSAYEDTVVATTGVRFTGLWYLRSQFVTVCAFGLDLGDYHVDTNGTVFVPYGSGTAPASIDYTQVGAGAYLFTAAYISANLSATDVRNGGVPYGGKYMPCVVGYTYTSQGQILRPIAAEQSGTRAGPSFGQLRRSHYVKALLHNSLGLAFGTDFTKMRPANLADDSGTRPLPTQPYSDLWRETLEDGYTFNSMLAWQIVRPYPASVISIGASVQAQDA